jgi:hypothetical protein
MPEARGSPAGKRPTECFSDSREDPVAYTNLVAERRQADASALATRICKALGLARPDLSRLPPLPEGLLVVQPPLHPPFDQDFTHRARTPSCRRNEPRGRQLAAQGRGRC